MTKKLFVQCILSLIAIVNFTALSENIIFDLNGVLFKTDKMYVAGKVGIFSLAWTAISTGQNPQTYFFNILDTIEPFTQTNIKTCDDKGNELPGVMCDWLKGIPSKKILKRISKSIGKNNTISKLASILFDPQTAVKSQKLIAQGTSFVQKCKDKGHAVYVLSNWDSESFDLIQNLYPEFWCLFDGILISGDCGLIKPDTKIYSYFLKQFKLDPSTCFFLDNQIENIKAAQEVGIKGTLVTSSWSGKPKFKHVKKDLNAWLTQRKSTKKQIT